MKEKIISICFLVYQSVIENQIPVVLLEGTGGCCDRFAKCYELYNLYHSKEKSVEEEPLDSESGEEFSGKNEEIKTKLREKLKRFRSEVINRFLFESW